MNFKLFGFQITNEKKQNELSQFYNATMPKVNRWSLTPKNLEATEAATKGLLFTCINEHAKAASFLPQISKRINQIDTKLLPLDHWAVQLFHNPNPIYTSQEFYPLIVKWLRINGNVFIFTPDFGTGVPLQQWILNPTRVRIVMGDGDDLIKGYEYWGSGGRMFFEEKDVLHIRTLEPSNHDVGQLIGVGLINAAIENSNIDAEGKAFLQRYYNNDARPPQILRDGDQYFTDSEQWELFKSKWNTELTNNQLRAKIQGEGMKIESLIGSAVNLDFGEVHEINRQAISEVFGLPLDLLNGKLNGKAVTRDIINRYHLNTINPLLELIDAAYTKHLNRFDNSIVVEHELYVDDDPEEIRLQEIHELLTGQTTINKLRQKSNLPPIQDGDTIFVPNGATTLKKAIEAPIPIQTFNYEGEKKKFNFVIKSEDEKEIVWRAFDTLTVNHADKLKKQIAKVFDGLEKEIKGNLGKDSKALESKDLFNYEFWKKEIEIATGETLTELQFEAIKKSLATVKHSLQDLPSSFSDEMVIELEKSTAKITESIGTIRKEVIELVNSNSDSTASELFDKITAKFDTLKTSRAEAIAQTSANHTTGAAQSKTWGALEIQYMWLSQRDGVTRATHEEADGTLPNEAGNFNIGGDLMPHPCAGGIAAENVNCRCSLFPVKKEK